MKKQKGGYCTAVYSHLMFDGHFLGQAGA